MSAPIFKPYFAKKAHEHANTKKPRELTPLLEEIRDENKAINEKHHSPTVIKKYCVFRLKSDF